MQDHSASGSRWCRWQRLLLLLRRGRRGQGDLVSDVADEGEARDDDDGRDEEGLDEVAPDCIVGHADNEPSRVGVDDDAGDGGCCACGGGEGRVAGVGDKVSDDGEEDHVDDILATDLEDVALVQAVGGCGGGLVDGDAHGVHELLHVPDGFHALHGWGADGAAIGEAEDGGEGGVEFLGGDVDGDARGSVGALARVEGPELEGCACIQKEEE